MTAALNGDPVAVPELTAAALGTVTALRGLIGSGRAVHQPEAAELTVEVELPGTDVIPAERGWRHVVTWRAVVPIERKPAELAAIYADVIGQVTLAVLATCFRAFPPGSSTQPDRGHPPGLGSFRRPLARVGREPVIGGRAASAWDDRGMRVGLHALGIGSGARRSTIDAVAVEAERCGFATLWSGEHVVMVDSSSSRYPYSADGRIAVPPTADWIDPMVGLSFAAAATSTIGVATGVLLLPEHNPVVTAKQAATLDVLCGGRLTLGVGIGWSREEFDALGVPFPRRAARTEEYVAAMRTLWRDDVASFAGEFVGFDRVRVNPKPHEGRQIPIMVGGNSDAALRRAAAWGDGWYGFNLAGMADVADRLAYLDARCRDSGRDPAVLRRAVALRQPRDGDVAALTDLGVDELVIVESPPADPRRAAGWVSSLADRWLPTETSPA